jgi:hypothetical protein
MPRLRPAGPSKVRDGNTLGHATCTFWFPKCSSRGSEISEGYEISEATSLILRVASFEFQYHALGPARPESFRFF